MCNQNLILFEGCVCVWFHAVLIITFFLQKLFLLHKYSLVLKCKKTLSLYSLTNGLLIKCFLKRVEFISQFSLFQLCEAVPRWQKQ